MKTFKQISAQIERIERLYYNFGDWLTECCIEDEDLN